VDGHEIVFIWEASIFSQGQTNMQMETDIAEKGRFWMKTSYFVRVGKKFL